MAPPSFDRPQTTRTEQPSVGHVLRERREELGWDIDAVAEWLRIRARMLVALEGDDFKAFPGTAYAVGFLRTYARALNLNAEDLVARYQRQSNGTVARKPDLVFPQPQDDRSIPVGVLIGAGLVVVVAAYAGWYRFANHDVPAERRVPAVAELMPGAATPLTTSPQVASVMPGQAPVPRPDDHPVVTAPTGPAQVPSAASTSAALPASPTTKAPVAPVPDTPAAPPTVAPAATPSAPAAPPAGDGRIGVHAQASVWTQIRDQSGHVVLSRVLQPGETWMGEVTGAPYTMTFGNAGGIVLTLDGATTAPLGREGSVRRNVAVSADAIRAGAFGTGPALPAATTPVSRPDVSAATVSSATPVGAPENTAPGNVLPVRRVETHHAPRPAPHVTAEPTTDELNARQLERSAAPH